MSVSGTDRSRVAVGGAGRAAGVVAAAAAAILWVVFLFHNPYSAPAEGRILLFGSLMLLASALSAVAAALGAHLAMYLLFVLSFLPVGFYVMLGPGIFQAIGWLNLAYLASAALVHRRVRARHHTRD